MFKKSAALVILFFISVSVIFARGENITMKIAVIGPGDKIYFRWGHIALMVEDKSTGGSYFFDYGIFSFDYENFVTNFAFGRLLYKCAVSTSKRNFDIYKSTNRDITLYTLDLPPETKHDVYLFAANNVLPENCRYFYHHYRDNCSTRIRDIIDLATDGQFFELYGNAPGNLTYRQHVRRHLWYSPFLNWFLNFLMGQVIDDPITEWDDMFLPSETAARINDFWYTDINGERKKLVSSVESVYKAHGRPPILAKPRIQWPRELALSLALSCLFGFFFYLQHKKKKAGRVLAGISVSICSLFFGIAGVLLYFMNLFTNHDYTYQNANMIFCTPLLLAAFPAGLYYALSKKPKKEKANGELIRLVWLLCAAGILISMLIKLLPSFYQDNLPDQMLMLPIALLFTLQPNGLKETLDRFRRKTP